MLFSVCLKVKLMVDGIKKEIKGSQHSTAQYSINNTQGTDI